MTEQEASAFRRFYGRMLFAPSPEVQATLASLLDRYALRFVEMLRERCTELSDNEFYWRVTFCVPPRLARLRTLDGRGQ